MSGKEQTQDTEKCNDALLAFLKLAGIPTCLPPWQAHMSARTGKPYWHNPETTETTWKCPVQKPEQSNVSRLGSEESEGGGRDVAVGKSEWTEGIGGRALDGGGDGESSSGLASDHMQKHFSVRKKEKEVEEEEGKEEVAEVKVVAVGEKRGQVVEPLLLTSMRENCGQVY